MAKTGTGSSVFSAHNCAARSMLCGLSPTRITPDRARFVSYLRMVEAIVPSPVLRVKQSKRALLLVVAPMSARL